MSLNLEEEEPVIIRWYKDLTENKLEEVWGQITESNTSESEGKMAARRCQSSNTTRDKEPWKPKSELLLAKSDVEISRLPQNKNKKGKVDQRGGGG